MMTTLAALVGALPIALGWGAGAELRQPLGLAVVGGLVFSQAITLFINGEPETAKLILHDLVNASVGFEKLAQEIQVPRVTLTLTWQKHSLLA
jgi:hypothetical protein